MKNIILFSVSEEDGVYTAEGVNVPVVTDGSTFEELKSNLREAVELYFEGEDVNALGFGPAPSILTNFEVPLSLHGAKA